MLVIGCLFLDSGDVKRYHRHSGIPDLLSTADAFAFETDVQCVREEIGSAGSIREACGLDDLGINCHPCFFDVLDANATPKKASGSVPHDALLFTFHQPRNYFENHNTNPDTTRQQDELEYRVRLVRLVHLCPVPGRKST